jgi:aldose 1-epimerase
MELFGLTPESEIVDSCELSNNNGMKLKVINYGATVTSLKIPLKNGTVLDVVLGFDTLDSYMKSFELAGAPYLGATVGRYAGRINNAVFSLNGKTHHLNKNSNNHSLHGGKIGFSQRIWKVKNSRQGENPSVTLAYCSPDNEEYFPGELTVELTYGVSEENEFSIEYKATTTEDTVLNLTHHSYFNLDGHQSDISDQELTVNSKKIVETTTENIPTSKFLDIKNHPFDFSSPKKCLKKMDTTFVLESGNQVSATLFNPKNNLKMTVFTNQPAVHIYVGGSCSKDIKGKENTDYHSLSGICFETQNFPDAPNHELFPSAILKKGEVYCHKTVYKFESF